jgi:ankyrin repeat protein
MKRKTAVLLLCAAALHAAPAITEPGNRNTALVKAVRAGDVGRMKAMLDEGADPNTTDEQGTPAVMNAVLYAGPQALKLLIDRGANPNAKDQMGGNALVWAAGNPEKARILINAGADVNAVSRMGRTALHNAAAVSGGAPIVKMLLEKGARVDARDNLEGIPVIPTGGGKGTPLIEAARVGDVESVALLIKAGADVNATDHRKATALSEAALYGRRDIVNLLLENKASASVAVTMVKHPLLSMAAMGGDVEVARLLVRANAPVNVSDASGVTPLMWAAYSDRINSGMVQFLLTAGADPKAVNKAGESALDWAARRGETRVTRMLREAGAPQKVTTASPAPERASAPVPIEQTIALLSKAGEAAMKKSGCASCHHHTLPLMTFASAKRHKIPVNTESEKKINAALMGMVKPMTPVLLEGSDVAPDLPVTGGYILEALAAQAYPADQITSAMVHNIALKQRADGRWAGWAPRPPLENGDIQATAYSIRAIRLYAMPGRSAELEDRIARAAQWLRNTRPVTTEDHIMRMLGLKWAGVRTSTVHKAAWALIRLQRKDGGWGQLPTLPSDAYATAKASYALREVAGHPAGHLAARKGAQYLRDTQLADGSWRVQSRSFPFQPLTDSGFPHGRDQWISAAATSYAALALMP